jgi:hypothetical protein
MQGLGTKKNTVCVENRGKAQESKGQIAIRVIPTLDGGLTGIRRELELEGGPTGLTLARRAYPGPVIHTYPRPTLARPGRPALAKGD